MLYVFCFLQFLFDIGLRYGIPPLEILAFCFYVIAKDPLLIKSSFPFKNVK